MIRFTLFVLLACCVFKGNCQNEDRFSDASDYQSVRNAYYDIAAATNRNQYNYEDQQTNNIVSENTISQSKKPASPFPSRLSLKVEDDTSDFKACGGFSSGTTGTCCSACAKMNFRKGCWCRTWDCLCFNS